MLIDFDLLSYLIGFIFLGMILTIMKIRFNKSNIYLFFFSVFSFYLMNVAKYTIFPIVIGTEWVEYLKETSTFYANINFIPFKEQDLNQTLLNILLTIPFGFGLPYIKKTINFKSLLSASVIFAFSIEITQLLISITIGYAYRVIDINDIMANTLGSVIGYTTFLLLSQLSIFKSLTILVKKEGEFNNESNKRKS